MTCALCTRGGEQSVQLLDRVWWASATVSTGLGRVEASQCVSLHVRGVRDRVRKSGFRVGGECETEAIGRFTFDSEGRVTFRIPGTVYAYQVLEGSELKRLFRARPGLAGDFFVAFRLHEPPRWKSPAISTVRGEPRGDAKSGR